MFRKSILLTILLLFLLTIAAVSASENISDSGSEIHDVNGVSLAMSCDDQSQSSIDDQLFSTQSGEEVLSESIADYIETYDEVFIDDYGGSNIVYFSDISPNCEDNITILIDDEEVYKNQLESYLSVHVLDLSSVPGFGLHNLTILYGGGYYQLFNKTVSVNFTYPFEVYRSYSSDTDQLMFEISLPKNNVSHVLGLNLNDVSYGNVTFDEFNSFFVSMDYLRIGRNTLIVTYSDSLRPEKSASCTFDVYPMFNLPNELIFDSDSANVSVRVPKNVDGVLKLYRIEDSSQIEELVDSANVSDGIAMINIPKSINKTDYFVEFGEDIMYFSLDFVNSCDLFDVIVPSEANTTDGLTIQLFNFKTEYDCYFDILVNGSIRINYRYLSDSLNVTIKNIEPGVNEITVRPSYYVDIFSQPSYFTRSFHVTVHNTTVENHSDTWWEDLENVPIDLNGSDVGGDDNSSDNFTDSNSSSTDGSNSAVDVPSKSTPSSKTVKKTNKISLTLKAVKIKKSAKKLVLTAVLKINNKKYKSKLLVFKFNGKTYKKRTNKYGVAKVTVKKSVLRKLKFKKKITYQVSYGKKTVKRKAIVKR